MNDIILHLSDLHISDHSGDFGRSYDDTFMTTKDEEINYSFISSLTDFIKKQSFENLYLVITGDITDCGEESEFAIAEKYILQILDELNISKEKLLLVPGDHDINRGNLRKSIDEKILDEGDAHILHDEKFNSFKTFYKTVKGEDFIASKFIFSFIETNKIVLLGVNSNYKIGTKGGAGYLPIELFEKELKSYSEKYRDKELIICMHHNLHGEHEDKQSGQWDASNRKNLIKVFQRNKIKCIFNGNEHTPNSKFLDTTDIIISDSGPLTCIKKPHGSFKTYEISNNDQGVYLTNKLFKLISNGSANEPEFGNWTDINMKNTGGLEQEIFYFEEVSNPQTTPPIELPFHNLEQESSISELTSLTEDDYEPDIYINTKIQNQLYEIIKNKKLFNQGHFHWSATSRAHNWIDISTMLEDRSNLNFLENAIIDVIINKTDSEFDLIIGLGYEGNIISTKASICFDVPYVYLPYSYRYKDHHKLENNLNFKNDEQKFKKVLIITDVVNDGRTIRKLIGKRESDFFNGVEEVIVISLFYTGENKIIDSNILNYNELPETYDKHNDHEINKIKFYFIKYLQVEKCPFGDNYKTDCLIYKDDLNCVHKFYTEED